MTRLFFNVCEDAHSLSRTHTFESFIELTTCVCSLSKVKIIMSLGLHLPLSFFRKSLHSKNIFHHARCSRKTFARIRVANFRTFRKLLRSCSSPSPDPPSLRHFSPSQGVVCGCSLLE